MRIIPEKISQILSQRNEKTTLSYIGYLDVNQKKPVFRTFAYTNSKKRGLIIQEIYREYLDHNEANDCFYFTQMGGYRVIWKGTKRSSGYNAYWIPEYKFSKIYDKFWRPNIFIEFSQTANEITDILKKFIPYFYLPNFTNIFSIMEFARTYKSCKRLELLSKAGFPYFYRDKMILKCNDKRMKQIASWIKNNKGFMFSYLPNYKFIINAIDKNENGEDHVMRLSIEKDTKTLEEIEISRTFEQMKYIEKYIQKQGCDIYIYRDYLTMRQKLNANLNDKSILYPRNLMLMHDKLMDIIVSEKNKKLNKKLLRKYNKFVKYVCNIGKLKIVIPQCNSDFVKWGEILNNCVGSLGYSEKMSNGSCVIVGIFKGKNIVECCELSNKYEIVQLRGKNNQPSEFHEKAEILVNKFIGNIMSSNEKMQFTR